MNHIKTFKLFESIMKDNDLMILISDIMVDEDFKYVFVDTTHRMQEPQGFPPQGLMVESFILIVKKDLRETSYASFKFNEVIPLLNELISQISSYGYDLSEINYRVGSAGKRYPLSMDPVSGEIEGNKVIRIKHPVDGKDVSHVPIIREVSIKFEQ